MTASFVHLHTHTDYSLLAACLEIETLLKRTKELGMTAAAITDSGNLYGVIPFYRDALKMGIKPIVGMEIYMAPGSRHEKKDRVSWPFVLLAEDNTGLQNLIKLSSLAHLEGFHYRPRVDRELLRQYHQGLICLSGGMQSELSHHILMEDVARAREVAQEYRDIFGRDHYFIELMDHGLPDERKILPAAVELAKSLKIPVVAANDVRYAVREHVRALEFMFCLRNGQTFEDPNRFRPDSSDNFLKSPEEMAALFVSVPEAIANTVEIANRTRVDIDFGKFHLPKFTPPAGQTPESYLRQLCEEGLARRYGSMSNEVRERFEYEFGVIKQMGYIDYFLIIWDIIHFARANGIPVGPGRGSAAGSICAYALGVTQIEPLANGLLFERFLNSSRISMPDVDMDFCQANRHRVIEYARQKYGKDCVAQIITFGTMKARAAIRDVGRVLNVPLVKVDKIAKLVPEELNITLRDALGKEPALQELHDTDPQVKDIFDIATVVEGMNRHASVHAAGVVIADRDLTEYVPVTIMEDDLVTQYSMEPLEQVGMLKMDFLGLDALTIVASALQHIRRNHQAEIDFETLPMTDKATFQLISTGDLRGVFQLESTGMQDLCRRMRPDNFEDVTALIALYRPGPLGSGMVDSYVRCKHGQERPKFLHPCLETILKPTYGVILYQEQVMQIASAMAGFSMNEADNLRKAMGKKIPEIMAKFRDRFLSGAKANTIPDAIASQTFEQMEFFAGYGFNKSHSAAYAAVTYRTAYLKAHYPEEFMAALMSCKRENTDKIVACINDCRRMSIQVLPPDINRSESDFTPRKSMIHFGLAGIKGVGEKAVRAILEARQRKTAGFESLHDFCESVDLRAVNKQVCEALIKAGAFDQFGARRAQLAAALESAMNAGSSSQMDRRAGQKSLFESMLGGGAEAPKPTLPDVPEWVETDLLRYEKETLGFYITSHPLVTYSDLLTQFSNASLANLKDLNDGVEITIGVMVLDCKILTTKKGDQMARLKIEDLTGETEAVVFSKYLKDCRELLEENAIVFIRCRVDLTRETPQLIVSQVTPVADALQRLTTRVLIKLAAAGADKSRLDALQKILRASPGNAAVYLKLVMSGKQKVTIKLGDAFNVAPTPTLLRELTAFLGDGHVRCFP